MTVDIRTAVLIYMKVTGALYVRPPIHRPHWTTKQLRARHERIKSWMGPEMWWISRDYASHWHKIKYSTHWPDHKYSRGGVIK